LTARLTADVLTGMMEFWESYITAQVLAMRDIERTAMQADMSALGGVLGKAIEQRITTKPNTPPVLECTVDVKLFGEFDRSTEEYDARVPIRVSAYLKGFGEVGEHQQAVKFEVVSEEIVVLEEGTKERGALLKETIRVRALADNGAGPVLAESKTETFKVRKQPEKDGLTKTVPIMKREERRPDGSLSMIYSYIRAFTGMPREWFSNYQGQIYHGRLQEFSSKELPVSECNFKLGVRDGLARDFDSEGRLIHEWHYQDEKFHGLEIRFDPGSEARLETRWNMDVMLSQRGFWENGNKAVDVSYQWEDEPGTSSQLATGQVETWHSNGAPNFKGRFEKSRIDLSVLKPEGEGTYRRKVGAWEWSNRKGALVRRANFRDGIRHGLQEAWRDDGKPSSRYTYDMDVPDGIWEDYFENGSVFESGSMANGRRHGVWIENYEDGTPKSRVTWLKGKETGTVEYFFEDGTVEEKGVVLDSRKTGKWLERWTDGSYREGEYKDDRRHGKWISVRADGKMEWKREYENGEEHGECTEYFENGKVSESGRCVNGSRSGRWERFNKDGKRSGWGIYDAEGELTGTGSYDD